MAPTETAEVHEADNVEDFEAVVAALEKEQALVAATGEMKTAEGLAIMKSTAGSSKWDQEDTLPLLLSGALPDVFTTDEELTEVADVEAALAPEVEVSYDFDDELFVVRKLTADGKHVLAEGKIFAKHGRSGAESATAIFADGTEYNVPQVTVDDLISREAGGSSKRSLSALAQPKAKKKKTSSTEFEIKQEGTGHIIKVVPRPQAGRADLMLVVEEVPGQRKPKQRAQVDSTFNGFEKAKAVCIRLAEMLARGAMTKGEVVALRERYLEGDGTADGTAEEDKDAIADDLESADEGGEEREEEAAEIDEEDPMSE